MAANQPLAHRYKEIAVKTANPLQLVVILYDGAIRSLKEAQEHLKRKDIASRARCINASVAMISELQACLNFKDGGGIAESLHQLYNYMKTLIFKANLEQRPEPLIEVVALLENLRSGWGELVAQAEGRSIQADARNADSPVQRQGASGQNSLNISG